jgi:hypothetical protein
VAEQKTLTISGRNVKVTELEIKHRRREEPNEYELEDGTIIRVSSPSLVIYRVEGTTDLEGNPTFLVKTGISTVVVRPAKTPNE